MSAKASDCQNPSEAAATTVERPGRELINYVYDELRRLAAAKLRRIPQCGQTLQATALVHEAYLRLSRRGDKVWQGRRHFYHAAALAMRYILIERARRRRAAKHGGGWQQQEITVSLAGCDNGSVLSPEDVLALDQVLTKLQSEHPDLVEIVLMRYFCGLTMAEISKTLGLGLRTVERKWAFARAWLLTHMSTTIPAPAP